MLLSGSGQAAVVLGSSAAALGGGSTSPAVSAASRLSEHGGVSAAVPDTFVEIYRRGDRWMGRFIAAHLAFTALLAPVYGTWSVSLVAGALAAAAFFVCRWLRPGSLLTRCMAGVSLQAFCALHIYQMRGLAEMHFFFFTAVTAMIIYEDSRALWPGVWAIIAQHTLFSYWHNSGVHPGGQHFFEPDQVSALKLTFHFGIALVQVVIASVCSRALRNRTLRAAAQRTEVEAANTMLQEQQLELELTNEQLQDNAFEMAAQTDELHATTDRLMQQTAAAEAARAAAEALAAERAATLGQLTDGVIVTDPAGHITFVNEAARRLHGVAALDVGVEDYATTYHLLTLDGEPHPPEELPLARAVLRGETVLNAEWLVRQPSGAVVVAQGSAAPLVDSADPTRRFGAVLTLRDVTALRALEHERTALLAAERAARAEAEEARRNAEKANEVKAEFLRTMSHELRTTLNAIGGYAELMEMGIRGPITPQQTEDLGRIKASQRHLLGLVNEVLNYARIETGTMRYDVADVSLAAVIKSVEPLVAPQLAARGLAFIARCANPAPVARADQEKVRQVLLNLLSNAIKFTEPGGQVEVTCGARGDWVEISVNDTGMGIAPEDLDRAFEPFVQVNASLTRTHDGTGLGLAISRDLARGMGGELTAESILGVGSTFILVLPRA